MMATLSKFKYLILIVILVVIAFLAYTKFMPASSATSSNALVRTSQTASTGGNTSASEGPGREFVNQLLAIQNIRFNVDIFSDPAYLSLVDFSRELIPQPAGRPNPFAPLGQNDTEVSASGSSTNGFTISAQGTTTASTSRTTRPR
ncbi:MAG: hypothetical protein RL094_777 [Candidatus Parcubacteria bacterium]|jgi:hypothetical protein